MVRGEALVACPHCGSQSRIPVIALQHNNYHCSRAGPVSRSPTSVCRQKIKISGRSAADRRASFRSAGAIRVMMISPDGHNKNDPPRKDRDTPGGPVLPRGNERR